MPIVIASRNTGKIREIKNILKELKVELLSLEDFPQLPSIEENGTTFLENALKKAQIVSQYTGQWALADDSGLEVEMLAGAPGVKSARYASPSASDIENIQKLLAELKGVTKRRACFRAVIVLLSPKGEKLVEEGEVWGEIANSPGGENGFGYDPVFYLPEYNKTMAELPTEIKNQISHRAQALKQLKEKMENTFFS